MTRLLYLAVVFFLTLQTSCAQERTPPKNTVIALWENGAPGFEDRKDIPETAQEWWVRSIHNPSLTLFKPNNNKSRTAVIVVPGGGHHSVVWPSEGVRAAEHMQSIGITAFALKYRLQREEGSDYDIEKHAAEDLRRAIRYVRANADEYGIDTVGIFAFSAGGELANLVSFYPGNGDLNAVDPIERESAHPDFQIQIYPGPIGIPDHAKNPPPAFYLAAFDDKGPELTISRLLELHRIADVPAEVHIYAGGGHAFNMGQRAATRGLQNWPDRLTDWMVDRAYIKAPP